MTKEDKEEETFNAICKRLETEKKWTTYDRNLYRITKLRYIRSHRAYDPDTCCCIFVLAILLLLTFGTFCWQIDVAFQHFSIPTLLKHGN